MDYNLALGILALLVSVYGAYLQRKQVEMLKAQQLQKKKQLLSIAPWWKSPHIVVLVILVFLVWVPYILTRTMHRIPNDGSDAAAVVGWGGTGPGLFYVTANGSHLLLYESKYKLLAFSSFYDGTQNPQDVEFFEKSGVYDIISENIYMGIKFEVAELKTKRGALNFGLLLIPNGLNPGSFSTVHEAQELGAKLIWKGASN